MSITSAAVAIVMIIDTMRGAKVVLGGMPIVYRTGLGRFVEAVAEAPLNLVFMALVRARVRGDGLK